MEMRPLHFGGEAAECEAGVEAKDTLLLPGIEEFVGLRYIQLIRVDILDERPPGGITQKVFFVSCTEMCNNLNDSTQALSHFRGFSFPAGEIALFE